MKVGQQSSASNHPPKLQINDNRMSKAGCQSRQSQINCLHRRQQVQELKSSSEQASGCSCHCNTHVQQFATRVPTLTYGLFASHV